MDNEARVITSSSAVEEVAEKGRQDAAFRALLRRDPKAAIESIEIVIPKGVVVSLEGDTSETERLVVYDSTRELSDDDLEQVAGGVGVGLGGGVAAFQFRLRLPVIRTIGVYDVNPGSRAF